MKIPLKCERCSLHHELEPYELMVSIIDQVYGFICQEGHVSRTNLVNQSPEVTAVLQAWVDAGAALIGPSKLEVTCSLCDLSSKVDILGEVIVRTSRQAAEYDYMLFFCRHCECPRVHILTGYDGLLLLEQLQNYPVVEEEWEPLCSYEEEEFPPDRPISELHPLNAALLNDQDYLAEIFLRWKQESGRPSEPQ